ncbi:hypothetical protein YC2023_098942 [Brassica napus]
MSLEAKKKLHGPAGCSTPQEEGVLIHGVQKLSLADLHSLMKPMKKKEPWKQWCMRWSNQPCFKAMSKLVLIHCPRRKVIAFSWYWCGEFNMKKGVVFDMESSRERSMGEGEVGIDTNSSLSCHVLWSFKELTQLKHPQAFHRGGEFRRVIAIREEEEVRIQVVTLRTTPYHLNQGSKPNLIYLNMS